MIYTKLQNYTNMVVGKHGIQTMEVVLVVLLLLLLSNFFGGPHKCISLILEHTLDFLTCMVNEHAFLTLLSLNKIFSPH